MYAGDITIEELPLSEWKHILTDFSHHGGEPLLYPGFSELCQFCHSLGYTISVLSNGLLWTESLIERLDGIIAQL